jgi:signal transduction histidine kinase
MNTSKTILVIDDDKKFLFGLVAALRRDGFQVLSAASGSEGMSIIREAKPDMILCDVMMPPPNGLQLKKELAKDTQLGQIPFFFLTARVGLADKLVGLESGADGYITKPFDVGELLARIRSVLRRDEFGHQRGIQESLADLDKLRSSISSNLNQEMRTPLTIILATLELILREKYSQADDLGRFIHLASSSAYRMKFLTDDLEMLYEMDQGNLVFQAQTIDLTLQLQNPINPIQIMWAKKQLDIQLTIHPQVVLFAPRDQFSHILAHLVDNACKFSPEKGRVVVSVQPNAQGGCYLEVTNAGTAIPVELREKVFERFYQVSQDAGGLGVGLTIARAFARAWGGDVQVLDSPTGCRVRMVLPAASQD